MNKFKSVLRKKILPIFLGVAIIMGITGHMGCIKSNANEEDVDISCQEIESMESVNFEECDLENGDIRLIDTKQDGSQVVTEIGSEQSVITYYNKIGGKVFSEIIKYKELSNNKRGIMEPVYETIHKNYFYDKFFNEYLTIGCKAIYEIQYYNLTNMQAIQVQKYIDLIDSINSQVKKMQVLLGISAIAFAPIAIYILAEVAAGVSIGTIVAALKENFVILKLVATGTLTNVVEKFFGVHEERTEMKRLYDEIKTYGKKVGTVKK